MEIPMFSKYICILCILSALSITNFTWASSLCLQDEEKMLLGLKSELQFNVSLSGRLARWNQSEECCSWGGVECDDEGHVITLQLDNETISGEIKDSSILFRFRYLEKLNLAYNNFGGCKIPSAIQNLTHLMHLNLSTANFSGQVPLDLSLLTSLVSLDLSYSPLSLSYDPFDYYRSQKFMAIENPSLKMILQNLTSLRELYLDYVNISAQGGDWCSAISSSLPGLQILSLQRCGLSGPLHSSLVELQSLSILRLDNNILSAIVPSFFVNFSSLNTLTLSNCYLKGYFPDTIFQMRTLKYLDISYNWNLSGILPQFPQGGSFRMIKLSSCNFSGSLPNSINNLLMLAKIDFHSCSFTGTIPFTLTNLTKLTHLDLSGNSLSGSIPPFYMLKKLTHVDLSSNKLTGSIPSFHMLKKLTHVDVSSNKLTGSLSSVKFESNSNLVSLILEDNLFGGTIPHSVFVVPSLKYLSLSNNHFNGVVSDFPGLLSSNLEELDLSHNRLEGPVPELFFKFENLRHLSLSHNSFNGTVNFGNSRSFWLSSLDMSYNNLSFDSSGINSSMYAFSRLTELSLVSCNLHNFPDLRNRSYLSSLDLSRNHITGEIPSWIWDIGIGQLGQLNLSFNLLVDFQKPYQIPDSIDTLDLHSNQLKGELPDLPSAARIILLSDNQFEKFFPLSIGNFSHPDWFSFANNRLSGAIPTSLCNATNLITLDLSNNNLSGNIPSCLLQDHLNLVSLDLGGNNINGNIPDVFSRKCSLWDLDVSNNNLKGNIPPSLAYCKSLRIMNVGNNQIEDNFPCMMPSSLQILVLRSNKFHGELRCSESWPNLQIIDISSNNFSGCLCSMNFSSWKRMLQDSDSPQLANDLYLWVIGTGSGSNYWNKATLTFKAQEFKLSKILTTLTLIDFSCNNFQWEIPNAIGHLKSLYALNLSHNALTGTVPKSFSHLTRLGSLDLSMNMLTGEIPKELATLTSLSALNLSYNKLVGEIPHGNQLQTFSPSSYQGNTGLCGFPLNRCSNDTKENGGSGHGEESYKKEEIKWEYIFGAGGFGVGFGSSVWVLLGCEWMRAIFWEKAERVFEYILVKRKREQRRRVQERNEVRRG